jgi:hypothetical protein
MKRPLRTRLALVAATLSLGWYGCSADSPDVTGPPPEFSAAGQQRLEQAMRVQERHTPRLMAAADVVGTAVGLDAAGNPVVKVYLARGTVPRLPAQLEGFRVSPEVVGTIRALGTRGQDAAPRAPPCTEPPCPSARPGSVDPTARFPRPVPIGVSTGHPDITAGTIGARVTDGTSVWALSNNHVYADQNNASIGDEALQPGPFDGGLTGVDAIGTLADFEPIVISTSANNVMDAAIAVSSPALLGNATPSDGYGTPAVASVSAVPGMRVMKYGRTTGLTKGRVDAVNAIINVQYDAGVARFVQQVVIRGRFSAGGDSGSLIVVERGTDARKAVALLFAGGSGITIGNPIGAVLTRFGVTIDGQ